MSRRGRPGAAVAALGVIVLVTVSWWALALYPAGAAAPEWVVRTRLACFGAEPNGLPNAGGWVLLVGEPIGMLGVLLVVWRDAVVRDLRTLAARWWGVALMVAVGASLALGAHVAGRHVRRTLAAGRLPAPTVLDAAPPRAIGADAPSLRLTDQEGRHFDLAALHGRPVLVTFAYGHCQTICPTIVHDLLRIRETAKRSDIPLVVVTLDPWRDVPERLPTMAEAWGIGASDVLLSGGIDEVNAALDAWGVARSRNPRTGEIDHASAVVLVDRDGRLAYRLDGNWLRLGDLLPGA